MKKYYSHQILLGVFSCLSLAMTPVCIHAAHSSHDSTSIQKTDHQKVCTYCVKEHNNGYLRLYGGINLSSLDSNTEVSAQRDISTGKVVTTSPDAATIAAVPDGNTYNLIETTKNYQDNIDTSFKYTSNYALGFGAGFAFTEKWAGELSWNYTKLKLSDISIGDGTEDTTTTVMTRVVAGTDTAGAVTNDPTVNKNLAYSQGTLTGQNIQASAIYSLTKPDAMLFHPYVGVSLGWLVKANMDLKPASDLHALNYSSASRILGGALVGMGLNINPSTEFTIEFRYTRLLSDEKLTLSKDGNSADTITGVNYNPKTLLFGVKALL